MRYRTAFTREACRSSYPILRFVRYRTAFTREACRSSYPILRCMCVRTAFTRQACRSLYPILRCMRVRTAFTREACRSSYPILRCVHLINVVFRKFAYSLMSRVTASPNSIVSAIVNSDAYHQSPLLDKWSDNNHRYNYLSICQCMMNDFVIN